MHRLLLKLSKGALCLGAIAACLLATPARAQVEIRISPPAWFIATTQPVYYEGHASYWYGGQWHYRQGRNWRTYREEPRYLRDHRGHQNPGRRDYGRGQDHDRGREGGDRR
jgi:hypothetical protein